MGFVIPAVFFGFFGGWITLTGFSRLVRLKIASGGARTLTGLVMGAVGVGSGLLGFNLLTYQRLTEERPAATISFTRTAPQTYHATLDIPGEEPREFDVQGDEWRLDARFIKWHPMANIGGLDAYYRLDRLTGRYRDAQEEIDNPRSVYALAKNPGLDLWSLARDKRVARLKALDAYYGNSVYAPMNNEASFQVFATQNGLIVRPLNEAAKDALSTWQ